jgi:hypothetical protein
LQLKNYWSADSSGILVIEKEFEEELLLMFLSFVIFVEKHSKEKSLK